MQNSSFPEDQETLLSTLEKGAQIRQMESLVASASGTKLLDYFIGMGFAAQSVAEAIREHGEENSNVILEVLLNGSVSSTDTYLFTKSFEFTGNDKVEPSNEFASCSSSPNNELVNHFVGMGFKRKTVTKVIQEHGELKNLDSILETLLTYSAIEKTVAQQHSTNDEQPSIEEELYTSENEESIYWEYDSDDFAFEGSSELESEDESDPLACLKKMGYDKEEAAIAIQRCGPEASVIELADFIFAAQLSRSNDHFYPREIPQPRNRDYEKLGKRKCPSSDVLRKKIKMMKMNMDSISFPKPMIGFGLPTFVNPVTKRSIPDEALGPPFFYYENVACAPKGVWQKISECLYYVEPEFVDSKHICAAARKRGYVHNLPISKRFAVHPLPHMTIQEALPMTTHWWPSWDRRTKLSCLQTVYASAKTTDRIRQAIEKFDGDPPHAIQSYVLDECRKWNLVWVGRNKVAPLEPDEVEMLLGFPRNHTRGGGSNRTDRYRSLGNSFQVDTVAYHLSVLKEMYPNGMNVLSLFSGIGGAEVALHRLGIPLKNVVSVEKSEVNRNIVRSWWIQTNQKGNLIDLSDVQELDDAKISQFIDMFGGFDLVVGGSPCNNLAGNNRVSRDGLEGKESSLFFEYCRILHSVKTFMNR